MNRFLTARLAEDMTKYIFEVKSEIDTDSFVSRCGEIKKHFEDDPKMAIITMVLTGYSAMKLLDENQQLTAENKLLKERLNDLCKEELSKGVS